MTVHSDPPSPTPTPGNSSLVDEHDERSVLAAIHRDQVLVGYLQTPVDHLIDQVVNLVNESAQSATLAMQVHTEDEALLMMTETLLDSSVDRASDIWESYFYRFVCSFSDHIPLQLPQDKQHAQSPQSADNQELLALQASVDHEQERLASLRHLQPVHRRQIAALERSISGGSEDLRIWSQLNGGSSNTARTLPNEALTQAPPGHVECAKEPIPDANVGPNDPKHSAWMQEQLARALDMGADSATSACPHVLISPDSKWKADAFTT